MRYRTLLFDLEREAVPVRSICEFPGTVRFSPSGDLAAVLTKSRHVVIFRVKDW